jgi:hypothetical protein
LKRGYFGGSRVPGIVEEFYGRADFESQHVARVMGLRVIELDFAKRNRWKMNPPKHAAIIAAGARRR